MSPDIFQSLNLNLQKLILWFDFHILFFMVHLVKFHNKIDWLIDFCSPPFSCFFLACQHSDISTCLSCIWTHKPKLKPAFILLWRCNIKLYMQYMYILYVYVPFCLDLVICKSSWKQIKAEQTSLFLCVQNSLTNVFTLLCHSQHSCYFQLR